MKENWLPIPGREGVYSVSDRGRVRSEARVVFYKNGRYKPVPERIMKQDASSPRLSVCLCRDGYMVKKMVHALVLLAFDKPRPIGLHIRHLDGNPFNNILSNLKYGTPAENMQDRILHGRNPNLNKTHCKHGHLYDEENTYRPGPNKRACRICKKVNKLRHTAKVRALQTRE